MGCAQDNINPHKSLPRGERHARTRRVPTVARFNPRPRAGSDEDFCTAYDYSHKLQSTLPHGERLWPDEKYDLIVMLQSTLPHGERLWPFFTFAPQ